MLSIYHKNGGGIMSINLKITIKGILASRGVLSCYLINATARDLCYWWGRCCGNDINKFAKYK